MRCFACRASRAAAVWGPYWLENPSREGVKLRNSPRQLRSFRTCSAVPNFRCVKLTLGQEKAGATFWRQYATSGIQQSLFHFAVTYQLFMTNMHRPTSRTLPSESRPASNRSCRHRPVGYLRSNCWRQCHVMEQVSGQLCEGQVSPTDHLLDTVFTVLIRTLLEYTTAFMAGGGWRLDFRCCMLSLYNCSRRYVCIKWCRTIIIKQRSGAVWKSRWKSWKSLIVLTVSVDVKQHWTEMGLDHSSGDV